MSEICGPLCQHPSCWSAERNKLRRALYAKKGYVQKEERRLPALHRSKEPDDSTLPTYKIVHLGDSLVIPSSILSPRDVSFERDVDSRTTFFSGISSSNTTQHDKPIQGELTGRGLPVRLSPSTSKRRVSLRLATPLASSGGSRTSSAPSPRVGEISENKHGTLQKPDGCVSVLTVKHGGHQDQDSTFLPRLVWVPAKRKRKKYHKNADQERDVKLAVQCFDGNYLCDDWNDVSKTENSKSNRSFSKGSECRSTPRIYFRKLPPLDFNSNSSRKKSLKEQLTYQKALNQETTPEALQTPEGSVSIALRIPTPNNTRRSRRHSYPLDSSTQIFKLVGEDQKKKTGEATDRDVIEKRHITLRMIPTEDSPTKTFCKRRDSIKQLFKLPRVSVPKTCLKEMPTTYYHCRNSIPHYSLPNVRLKPLDVGERTPSVASTESLIGKIFVKFGYTGNEVPRALLDHDLSSMEAYEKLLEDFPDMNVNEHDNSIASRSMKWTCKKDTDGQLQSPASSKDQRKVTPSSFTDLSQGVLGQQEVCSELTKAYECDQGLDGSGRVSKMKETVAGYADASNSGALNAQEGDIAGQPAESSRSDAEAVRAASFLGKGEKEPNRSSQTTSTGKAFAPVLLPSFEHETANRDDFRKSLLFASESYAFEKYPIVGHREPVKRQLLWKSQSLPHVSQFSENELHQDLRVVEGHRFKSTKNKLPPLLMWTPSRVPPHPSHQPSAEQVPDELVVRSMELGTKSTSDNVDLSPSLTVTKLPHSKSDPAHPEMQHCKSRANSVLSTPIVVPTMSSTESRENTTVIHFSHLKSQSPLSANSDFLVKGNVTPEHDKTKDDGKELEKSKTTVCSTPLSTEEEVYTIQEIELEEGGNDDVTLRGESHSTANSLSLIISPDSEQGSAGLLSISSEERVHVLDDIYSSPLLTRMPNLMVDLELNLEDELKKAVSGLEGFSFTNIDIESVLSLDLDSVKSDIVNDVVLTDDEATEVGWKRNLLTPCSATSDPWRSRNFGRPCTANKCFSPEDRKIPNKPS